MFLVLNRILQNYTLQLSFIKVTVEQINLFRALKETVPNLKSEKHERTKRAEKGLNTSHGSPSSPLFLRGGNTLSISYFFFRSSSSYSIFMDFSNMLTL